MKNLISQQIARVSGFDFILLKIDSQRLFIRNLQVLSIVFERNCLVEVKLEIQVFTQVKELLLFSVKICFKF